MKCSVTQGARVRALATSSDARTADGDIDPAALGGHERAVFERWVDAAGRVTDRDIDTLLRQNLMLRRLIAELVASAGRPRSVQTGYVADVPTDMIEQASVHGDFSQVGDPEDHDDAAWR